MNDTEQVLAFFANHDMQSFLRWRVEGDRIQFSVSYRGQELDLDSGDILELDRAICVMESMVDGSYTDSAIALWFYRKTGVLPPHLHTDNKPLWSLLNEIGEPEAAIRWPEI